MNPEITKLIEQYLNGELSATDRAAFERKLAENEMLRKEVDFQPQIHEAAKRLSLRTAIKTTGKRYHLLRKLMIAGVLMIVLAIGSAVFYFSTKKQDDTPFTGQEKSELISQLEKLSPIENLQSSYFEWLGKDTVFISPNGVLLSVPQDAYLLNGKPYRGKIVLQYQEAMNVQDIVKSGLSTQSGDQLLETQGMFGIQAFTPEKQKLEVDPKVGIYVQVPVDEQKENMLLFEGKKLANGIIDWQNPQKLAKLPTLANMDKLDFYPQGYEDTLNKLKQRKDKKYRDSLYLSMEEFLTADRTSGVNDYLYVMNSYYDTIQTFSREQPLYDNDVFTGIPPSKVLAFWKPKFNRTNLATRDFEKRMRAIHHTCDDQVLKLYVNNLNLPLSEIDARVVKMGYTEFEAFSQENLAAVNPDNPHLANLAHFYEEEMKGLQQEAHDLLRIRLQKERDWDNKTREERNKEYKRTNDREVQNFNQELEHNTESVYRQLGKKRPELGPSVGFTITGNATIYNIDRFVMERTVSRTSGEFFDKETGKTAKLVYNEMKLQVKNADKYSRLFVYLFPDKLSSYHRINGKDGKFSYKLNGEFVYDLCIVGYTDKGYSFYSKKFIPAADLGEISLKKISETKLNASLSQMNSSRIGKRDDISEEISWLIREQADYKVQKIRQQMQAFRYRISRIVFPCQVEYEYSPELEFIEM